jgi:acetyl esterase
MTPSLPGQATPVGPPRAAKGPVVNALAGLTLRGLPRIPNGVKRVLLGGRSVTIDGNTLDTTLQLMLTGMTAVGLNALIASPDVVAARTQARILAASFKRDIPVARVTNLSIPGPAGPLPARHYRPVNGDGEPLLVFYHGGGQVVGDIETHDDVCRQMCREGGLHVLSVDYRLAPEHKAPAGSDDAYAAFGWALDHAGELGADPGRVAVGGDSAGGNLAALVSLRARDEGNRLPALQLLFYPITNYSGETRSQTLFAEGFYLTKKDLQYCRDQFLGGAQVDAADPRVSPLLADDLSGLPPALVLTAGFDPLRDEGRHYADAMREAGVAVDYREFGSLVHAFANFFPQGGGSAIAMAETISALRAHLARA